MNDHQIKHYYINLDRSADRRVHVEKQLNAYNLASTRIPGIDGLQLGPDLGGVDPALYRRCHGREIRPGEIGCYLSHLKALQAFLDTGDLFAVILEDDLVILPSYNAILSTLVDGSMTRHWDMVKLQSRRKKRPWHLHALAGESYLGVSALRSTGATAYMVNRKAARRMVERLLPMQVPWDHAFDRSVHLGIKVRAVWPYPVTIDFGQDVSATTIETVRAIKAQGPDRLRTYLWRAESEVCRFGAAVVALVQAKIF